MPSAILLSVMRPHRADPPRQRRPLTHRPRAGGPPERSSIMSDLHKQMAKRLRAELATRGISLSHSEALELVAHQHGARDWNTLAARPVPDEARPGPAESPAVP